MRDRKKQRQLLKEQNYCDRKNTYGKSDLTPYNAIQIMKGKDVKDIVLR